MKLGKAEKIFCPRGAGDVERATDRKRALVRRVGGSVLAALFLLSPAFAGWRDDAAPRDVERLSRLAESRAKGLDEASRGPSADFAAIRSVLSAEAVPASEGRLAGTWRCRSMKLGGVTPSIVYGWFRCRISQANGRLYFEKLGGSTRTVGYLYPDGGSFVYLGAQFVTAYGPAEKKPAYSGKGASIGAAATPDDQIGRLSFTRDGRARLELPDPVQESSFDVIEMKR